MTNVINLFETKKPAVKKDVSNETYYFTFNKTKFHFGGGAFTRELLARLDAKRDDIITLARIDTELKLAAVAANEWEPEMKEFLEQTFAQHGEMTADIIRNLKTPNDLDAFMDSDETIYFMPVILAAIIHATYVPFDLMRMQRANWCLIDTDANNFMKSLDEFFNQSVTDLRIEILDA